MCFFSVDVVRLWKSKVKSKAKGTLSLLTFQTRCRTWEVDLEVDLEVAKVEDY